MIQKDICIGIDASNISGGGGLTHLRELLNNFEPKKFNIDNVVLWTGKDTNKYLPDKKWLIKKSPNMIDKNIIYRIFWQIFFLKKSLNKHKCDILFVPGGIYLGFFEPFVSMSQNLLPFEKKEYLRFGFSITTLRFILLRIFQSITFKRSAGVIFLTEYAKQVVNKQVGKIQSSVLIPHGINSNFFLKPRNQIDYTKELGQKKIKIIYVSIINHYKHQWNVVKAIEKIRKEHDYLISLDLIGPNYPSAKVKLDIQVQLSDPLNEWINYHESVPHEELKNFYFDADMAVFASSCENLPIILLEKMAAGLPIICSNKGPMPEVLGSSGIYFDPEDYMNLSTQILKLIESRQLRTSLSEKSFQISKNYDWTNTSNETFKYLTNIILDNNNMRK